MSFVADFLGYVGLTVMTLLPIINPVGTAVLRMLFPDAVPVMSPEALAEARAKANISFSPLAMPSLSGPGSIAMVISMSSTIRLEERDARFMIEHVSAPSPASWDS